MLNRCPAVPPAMGGDVDVCAGSSFFDDDALGSGEPNVFAGGDRPNEGGDPELAEGRRNGDIDDVGWLSGSTESAMPDA